jgi:dCTP deaminase
MNDEIWRPVPTGTIVDTHLRDLADHGMIIGQGYQDKSVRQACYELHASDIFWETCSTDENKRIVLSGQSGYVLRPNSLVTAIVSESIDLPADAMARVIAKGKLFSVGILPVATYADPGFKGRLGITLYNASRRHLLLRPGDALAKIEFSKLATRVGAPYSGQHGYETEIWPIPVEMYATDQQMQEWNIDPEHIDEIERVYGKVVASLQRRLSYYEKKVWIQIAVTVVGFLVLFSVAGKISLVPAVATGIAANLLTSLVWNAWGLRRIKN